MRWMMALLIFLTSGVCLAEDNALLQKPVSVSIVSKSADEAIPQICAAAGVPVELKLIKQDPETANPGAGQSMGSSSSSHDGVNFTCQSLGTERLYTIQINAPVALEKALQDICAIEGLQCSARNGKLVISPVYELPFNEDAFSRAVRYKFAADANWGALIQQCVQARTQHEDFAKRDWQSGPLEIRRPINALKAHSAPDAVRAWLLSELAARVTQSGNSDSLSSASYGIAAARAAKEIYESANGAVELKELATAVRAVSEKAPADDRQLLAQQLAYGYLGAARAYALLRQHAEAVQWAKQAAYLLLSFGDDSFFDYYHDVVSKAGLPSTSIVYGTRLGVQIDANWSKIAAEDVNYMTEHKLPKPLLARAHYRLARAQFRHNAIAVALEELKAALELDPVDGGAPRRAPEIRGPLFGALGSNQPEPALRDVILDRANMLDKLGRHTAEFAVLEKAHADYPADKALIKELALHYLRAEQKDKAIACWKQYVELDPDNDFALNQLAKLQNRAVSYTDSRGLTFEGAPEVAEKYKQIIELNATVGRLKTEKKYDEALQAVRALLKHYPGSDELMLHEIHLLIKQDKLDEADVRLNEYVKISSEVGRTMTADALRNTIKQIRQAKEQNRPAPNTDF